MSWVEKERNLSLGAWEAKREAMKKADGENPALKTKGGGKMGSGREKKSEILTCWGIILKVKKKTKGEGGP